MKNPPGTSPWSANAIALLVRSVFSPVYDVRYRDRAAFLPFAETLVVSDLHVGRAEASDVAFPLGERSDLRDRLSALVEAFDPAEVVFAGDVLHRFDTATTAAESGLDELVGVCRNAGVKPILVRGNHDTVLASAWDGKVFDQYVVAESPTVVVCHGHTAPVAESEVESSATSETDASLYVIGHVHPAITIEGRRRPCYLYGESVYRGSDVLVLPAFSRLAAGVPVNGMDADDTRSPLVSDVDDFRPIVYDEDADDTLSFPPLGEFRRML